MNKKESNAWYGGVEWGVNSIFVEMFENTDKHKVLTALFRKAHEMADKCTNPIKKKQLLAYSEGFRHALNILNNYGNGLEAYNGIINPSIKIPLSKKDIDKLGM